MATSVAGPGVRPASVHSSALCEGGIGRFLDGRPGPATEVAIKFSNFEIFASKLWSNGLLDGEKYKSLRRPPDKHLAAFKFLVGGGASLCPSPRVSHLLLDVNHYIPSLSVARPFLRPGGTTCLRATSNRGCS